MGRPRSKPLPPGLFQRGRVIWCSFYDQTGTRVREAAGRSIEEARRHLADRERQVREGTYQRGAGTGERTIETYSRTWLELRAANKVRSVERERQIVRDHIAPHLGALRLSELRPRDVAAWIAKLGGSPKSVRNAHGVLSAMLSRARFEELVVDNAAKGLPKGILPRNVRTRQVGAWTREECAALIGHPGIPEDRRIAYAIAAFTGTRCGEVAGLRWMHIDTKAGPLWRWALRTQYDGQPLKTENPRDVPLHTELRALLERWRSDGWARYMRRHPRPEDLVVPREDGTVHSKESLGAKAVHRHAKVAGVSSAGRDFHSFRRSMITLCRTDGARPDVLERVTHNAANEQIDGYTYFGWQPLCEAVSCLRLSPQVIAPTVPLAVTIAVTTAGTEGKRARILNDPSPSGMEAPGVEASTAGGRETIEADSAAIVDLGAARARRVDPRGSAPVSHAVTIVTAADAVATLRAMLETATDAERAALTLAIEALQGATAATP